VDDLNLITRFDPWQSKLCTCPFKLTFNPYTGCDHRCVYCYASSYIPKFFECKPKKDLINRLKREATRLKGELISISNSSDPYPNLERESGLTRKCLEVLARQKCKIQIITKSDIVTRDADLLRKVPSMVSLTITTDNDEISKLIEPYAPPSSKRIKTVESLVQKNIPTSVRIDPIIPFVNDKAESLIETLASLGVKHVTCSTYKVKMDNWRRFSSAFPEVAKRLKPLYFEKGEKIGGYFYLPEGLRLELMKNLKAKVEENDMKFGTCRESLNFLNSATCDGSWLLGTQNVR